MVLQKKAVQKKQYRKRKAFRKRYRKTVQKSRQKTVQKIIEKVVKKPASAGFLMRFLELENVIFTTTYGWDCKIENRFLNAIMPHMKK